MHIHLACHASRSLTPSALHQHSLVQRPKAQNKPHPQPPQGQQLWHPDLCQPVLHTLGSLKPDKGHQSWASGECNIGSGAPSDHVLGKACIPCFYPAMAAARVAPPLPQRCDGLTLGQDEVLPAPLLQIRVSEQQEASDVGKPVLFGRERCPIRQGKHLLRQARSSAPLRRQRLVRSSGESSVLPAATGQSLQSGNHAEQQTETRTVPAQCSLCCAESSPPPVSRRTRRSLQSGRHPEKKGTPCCLHRSEACTCSHSNHALLPWSPSSSRQGSCAGMWAGQYAAHLADALHGHRLAPARVVRDSS